MSPSSVSKCALGTLGAIVLALACVPNAEAQDRRVDVITIRNATNFQGAYRITYNGQDYDYTIAPGQSNRHTFPLGQTFVTISFSNGGGNQSYKLATNFGTPESPGKIYEFRVSPTTGWCDLYAL
jgi:hypothetical protein